MHNISFGRLPMVLLLVVLQLIIVLIMTVQVVQGKLNWENPYKWCSRNSNRVATNFQNNYEMYNRVYQCRDSNTKRNSTGIKAYRCCKSAENNGNTECNNKYLAAIGTNFHRPILEPFSSTIIYNKGDNLVVTTLIENIQERTPVIVAYHPEFYQLIARNSTIETLATSSINIAHEAGVYCRKTNEVFFTTNRLGDKNGENQYVEIYKLNLETREVSLVKPTNKDIFMANGMTYDNRIDKIIVCSQGHRDVGGSLLSLDPVSHEVDTIVDNYFGLKFNSLNDVVVTNDGSYWFTDPSYGFEQHFRHAPQLGDFVYRYDPIKGNLRMVADGFIKPNGIAFSPDERMAYISDTGFFQGTGEFDVKRPHTIYEYDVISNGNFLANRRVFAMSDVGIPDGIKLDTQGNIYTGTADGVQVFNQNGMLLGKIIVPGGAANLIFADKNLILFSEMKIYSVTMLVQGAHTSQNNVVSKQTK